MENPCKLLLFGDSITKGYSPYLENRLRKEYPEISLQIINAGISGETTRDGMKRMPRLLDEKPDVVVIGFGMNDWRKGVGRAEYKENLVEMLNAFEGIGSRVIINTLSCSYDFQKRKYNSQVDEYSECVREIAYENRIKIADINALWKRELKKPQKGLRDDTHPNETGYKIICKALMWIVPRRNTTVLWQYNGKEAKCNYRCPYCYYIGLHSPKDRFVGTIEQWHDAFKDAFGNQHLILYLGHGEPTLGQGFPGIIEMCESEPNWELRIISNISTRQAKSAAETKLAAEGRLHIVGSFHPCMTEREKYFENLKYFRDKGIEVPTVYVGYPPYLKHFEEDISFFRKEGFLVHVRRLQGRYKGSNYPYAYTEEERKLLARYMDDGMLKYMHSGISSQGELAYSGLHFFVMDNVGNVGYDVNIFQPYTKYRCIFGNIHQRNFRPNLLPDPYPGTRVGTDDGIANIVRYGFKELDGNHVESFARQGGVFRDDNGNVVYGNEFKDFDDFYVRAEYNFPPRNLRDYYTACKYSGCADIKKYLGEIMHQSIFPPVRRILSRHPSIKNKIKKAAKLSGNKND